MPLRAEYQRDFARARATKPTVPQIGIRRLQTHDAQGVTRTVSIDPSRFACRVLAGELAAEVVELASAAGIASGTIRNYTRAIELLCTFADQRLNDPGRASLGAEEPDLHELLTNWANELPAANPPGSRRPFTMACAAKTLIARRLEHPDRPVTDLVGQWAEGAVLEERASARLVGRHIDVAPCDRIIRSGDITVRARWGPP
jgi:hypothetical protein